MTIKRTIELFLDRRAAKRVETDTKRALDRGTDPRKPKDNLGKIGKSLGGLKQLAIGIGLALGAAFITRKITQFGKEAVRVAQEATAIWNRLAGQLRIAGTEFDDVSDQINTTARAMQDATTVGDEDFAAILTELLSTTNDYAASLKEVETVANLAAAKQISLVTAAQLVGRAMVGQTGALSRYGIIVEKGGDAMEILRERFAGMAKNEAKTLQGRISQLSNEWSDFQQAIGDAMIAAGGGTSVIDTLIGTVKGLTIWVNDNRSAIAFWGSLVIDVFKAVGQTAVGIFNLVRSILVSTGALINTVVTGWQLLIARALDNVMALANRIIDGLNRLPGVDIEFRFNGLDTLHFERQAKAATDDLLKSLGGIPDALVQIGQGWVDVGRKALFAERSQASAAGVVPGVAPPGGGGGGAAPVVVDVAAAVEELETLEQRATDTAAGMTAAFDTFFAASALGFAGSQVVWAAAGQAAREAGAAIVEGLVAGRVKTEMALGTAALASGIWPPNPAAIASGLKHFAAAALFRAIPGALRGGGAGVGGGAGGLLPRGALASSAPGSTQPLGPEINIFIDPLSPADPRFQRVVLGATQSARERFGEGVSVNIHPRTGRL